MEIYLRTTGCRLPYGITQCYLPPDTSEHTTYVSVCVSCEIIAISVIKVTFEHNSQQLTALILLGDH